jgi:glycosyltransferase involved in cell wall biosynthesis
MKFSVVIPVYKVEKYLDQSVQSVLGQTHSDLEVILVDDGSPDRCGIMCDAWAAKDARIRVIHQQNGGLSVARNTGIRHATGDYLLFLDSDDWWETDAVLEAVAKQLERTPAQVLSFNYRKSFDGVVKSGYFDETLPSSKETESLTEIVRQDRWINGACNKALSRTMLMENDLFFRPGITSEDIDWTLRVALTAETFAFANVCVFVYRQHSASISHTVAPKNVRMLCDNVRTCVRLLEAAQTAKAEALTSYVAYQYATLIYNASTLSGEDQKPLMEDIRQMKGLLAYSDHSKVRMIYRCQCVFGLSATMALLKLRSKLLRLSGKGG